MMLPLTVFGDMHLMEWEWPKVCVMYTDRVWEITSVFVSNFFNSHETISQVLTIVST